MQLVKLFSGCRPADARDHRTARGDGGAQGGLGGSLFASGRDTIEPARSGFRRAASRIRECSAPRRSRKDSRESCRGACSRACCAYGGRSTSCKPSAHGCSIHIGHETLTGFSRACSGRSDSRASDAPPARSKARSLNRYTDEWPAHRQRQRGVAAGWEGRLDARSTY